ncbi:MAG: DUF4080 domain-containing protein [bacterium]
MILLCTLNARYIHCSLGLRYLKANIGDWYDQTEIKEFTINQRAIDMAEIILDKNPKIVGFGVYIWNVAQTTELIAILKSLRPELLIVLGGPEVSFETESSPTFGYADYIIQGQGDFAFKTLCDDLLADQASKKADIICSTKTSSEVAARIISAPIFKPQKLKLPYSLYSDEDIRQRVLYVEASRGCPFKCEFCLSSLDKTSQAFQIDEFLTEMECLYQRGARHFKFIDRTFNLQIKTCQKILNFFLSKPLDGLFLHFELIPDRLPDALKELIVQFPAGSLQFEVGIQSFNQDVQQKISRKQNHARTVENLRYLRQHTKVHLHTDLIAGLPGEDLQSFARGFNELVALNPQEIQVGILKRLRGTPIIRHSNNDQMCFNPNPPYTVLSTKDMDSHTLFRINRFARYWDIIANSGRFAYLMPQLLADQPFKHFMILTDWLFSETDQTHKIALPRLFKLLYRFLLDQQWPVDGLLKDYAASGLKKQLEPMQTEAQKSTTKIAQMASARQQRHL